MRIVADVNTRIGLGVLAIYLGGCAVTGIDQGDTVWYKEGATARERDAAMATAESQALQARSDPTNQTQKDIVLRSMTAQGWRLVPRASAPPLKPEGARRATTMP